MNLSELRINLIYRASKAGFSPSSFHQKCDNQGKTIIVIKSHDEEIFGGYADKPWRSSTGYI